jgi:hypothetical protein
VTAKVWSVQDVVEKFRQNARTRFETDTVRFDDGRPKILGHQTGARRIFSKCGNDDVTGKNAVLLKRREMGLGDVRLCVDELSVTNVFEANDTRPCIGVVIRFQLRSKRPIRDCVSFVRREFAKWNDRPWRVSPLPAKCCAKCARF